LIAVDGRFLIMTFPFLMRSLNRKLLLTAVLLCAFQAVATPVNRVADADANRRLEAIKQALIDLSLGTELQLASSAFLDERGVLHESSMITSQSQVRGVRVLSYLEEAGVGIADVAATLVSSDCPMARSGLRREALISVVQGGTNPRFGDHYLSEIGDLSKQLLSDVLSRSSIWSVTPAQRFNSGYHKKMSATGGNRPPFVIQLGLQQAEPESGMNLVAVKRYLGVQRNTALSWSKSQVPSLAGREPWSKQLLTLDMRLIDPVLGNTVLSETVEIDYPSMSRGYDKTPLPVEFVGQLESISQGFVQRLDEVLQCSAHYYHVSDQTTVKGPASSTNSVQINAGSNAGVQVGDQFLLSPTPQIIGQGASLGDIEKLILAEVQSVTQHTSMLKVTAGAGELVSNSSLGHNNLSRYVAIHF